MLDLTDLPSKLKDDAIIEALVELRFETADIPELTLGRLADHDLWREFSRSRTPIADVPVALRLADSNLKHQAILELKEPDGIRIAKIGTHMVSLHNVAHYIGWNDGFSDDIKSMVVLLLDKLQSVTLTRIGLRYINALTPSKHHVTSVSDLNIQIRVADNEQLSDFNINYRHTSENFVVLTRLATPGFVQGKLPPDTSAYVDVDVFTPADFTCRSSEQACQWIEEAHMREKQSFFSLIPPGILDRLRIDL